MGVERQQGTAYQPSLLEWSGSADSRLNNHSSETANSRKFLGCAAVPTLSF